MFDDYEGAAAVVILIAVILAVIGAGALFTLLTLFLLGELGFVTLKVAIWLTIVVFLLCWVRGRVD